MVKKARKPRTPTRLQTLKKELRSAQKASKARLRDIQRDLRSLGVGRKKK